MNKKMNPYKKQFEIRTDLALEEKESFPGDGDEISGVSLREWIEPESRIKMTEVKILNERGAAAMGKPAGTYLTLEIDSMTKKDESELALISEELARQILHQAAGLLASTPRSGPIHILAAGLGNPSVTPDSLGPRVARKLQVTRQLEHQYGSHFCQSRNLPLISAIVPGVMAQTGMETAEILTGILRETHPHLLIAVDALAARSVRRLGTTIQITDTGIHPGSGVGNHRHSLTRESLGIPVLAIGVPTVVGAAAIVHDTVSCLTKALLSSPAAQGLASYLDELTPEEQYQLIRELLEPEFGSLYVTPPDADELISTVSTTVSEGINKALFDIPKIISDIG
ncbi:MAG: GPR endopeptidase [Clostridiales bacterium]|nr:GPR endopeptidase [Clostridiales bacterium]